MCRIKYQSFITLWTIININGERWYSAPIIDRSNQLQEILEKQQHLGGRYNYNNDQSVPLLASPFHEKLGAYSRLQFDENLHFTTEPSPSPSKTFNRGNNLKAPGPQLYGSSDLHLEFYNTHSNDTRKPLKVITYNNTIKVINVIKRTTKPRRKIIRRRRPNSSNRQTKRISSKERGRTRFLEVFQVVEFQNVACISSSGLEGTCLHEYECQSGGGSTMGTCADGYGTCCVTLFPCDGQSAEPMGWFTNPGFPTPSSERLSCTFTLNKASIDVKQIRLDFVTFELLGPTAGTCQDDQFVVSGQNMNSIMPILCGINSGQHAYIEVGDIEVDSPIYFSVQSVSPDNRLFSIKVSQLTWADELAAPVGCLQYFTEPEGLLESFNFKDTSEIGIVRTPSYLNNLNYAMCIRRAQETCSVTYANAGDDYMQIVNYDLDGIPVIPEGQAGVEIFNCPSDWLLIAAIRLCGDRFNDGSILQDFSLDAPVTDNNAGPIAVWFRSDEGYVGRGFKLKYKQNTCNGPIE